MIDEQGDESSPSQDDPPSAKLASPSSESQRPDSGSAESGPGNLDLQGYIGLQLRAVYDDVAKQPIPDRFLELMRQLE